MKIYKLIAICIGVINLIGILLVGLTLTDRGYFFDGQFMAGLIIVVVSYIAIVALVVYLIIKRGR